MQTEGNMHPVGKMQTEGKIVLFLLSSGVLIISEVLFKLITLCLT